LLCLLLVFTIAVSTFALPAAFAHDPAWDVPTFAYITAAPNIVGVGQSLTLVMWLDKVPPTAAGQAGDRWINMKVDVTKPDGTKETLGPFMSDPVGSTYTIYHPNQVGNYRFELTFPGQKLTGSTGTGLYNNASLFGGVTPYLGDNYLASRASTTVTVQQVQLPPPVSYSLPTEYWTRPIEGQNTNWESVASNWLGESHIVGKYQPDGIAPNAPHIMWTKSIEDGGLVGGVSTSVEGGATFYDGTAYEGKFSVPLIMNGRLYYNLPRSDVSRLGYAGRGPDGGELAVDLRTGETLWYMNYTIDPDQGQLYYYESPNQHGVIPNGYLWAIDGSNWIAYDGINGQWLFTEQSVPAGTQVYGPNGEITRYVLDAAAKTLSLWNNTASHDLTNSANPSDTSSTNFYQWRPVGKTINASNAFSWTVSIPTLPPGSAVNKVIPDDMIIGSAGTSSLFFAGGDTYTVWAISLKPATRGQLLWTQTYTAPSGNVSRSFDAVDPVNRVFIMHDKETLQWIGYSIDNGNKLWGPTASEDPWNYYTWGSTVAEGKLFTNGYGIVYCYDTRTGNLLWNFSASGGLDIPYSNYPMAVGAIADGKVYVGIIEHSASAPYWKGAKVYALNITTGEEIWSIASHSPSTFGGNGAITTGFAIGDGYLTYLNLYNMQITCIGQGPSETTVTAPDTSTTLGNSVLIQGTVMDIAAGTKQNEQAARFPKGVPAVADKSMSAWMEYVYMQKPKPTDVTGVKVHLAGIDPNGNFQDLGTATTDINGKYGLSWTPPVGGIYHVTATFESCSSYFGSTDTTYFAVSKAVAPQVTPTSPSVPTATPVVIPTPTQAPTSAPVSPSPQVTTTPVPPPSNAGIPTTYIIIALIAIIVVVAAAALALRRRK
jgi:outer membrane protein assembly factor BamB